MILRVAIGVLSLIASCMVGCVTPTKMPETTDAEVIKIARTYAKKFDPDILDMQNVSIKTIERNEEQFVVSVVGLTYFTGKRSAEFGGFETVTEVLSMGFEVHIDRRSLEVIRVVGYQ